jgi:hypothetical protein
VKQGFCMMDDPRSRHAGGLQPALPAPLTRPPRRISASAMLSAVSCLSSPLCETPRYRWWPDGHWCTARSRHARPFTTQPRQLAWADGCCASRS